MVPVVFASYHWTKVFDFYTGCFKINITDFKGVYTEAYWSKSLDKYGVSDQPSLKYKAFEYFLIFSLLVISLEFLNLRKSNVVFQLSKSSLLKQKTLRSDIGLGVAGILSPPTFYTIFLLFLPVFV